MISRLLISLFLLTFFYLAKAQQTVGIFTNTPEAFDGYTLFAPITSTETYLIDNCGELVHSWPSQYRPSLSCYLLEDGSLLRTGRITGMNGGSGIVERIDWDGNVTWSYSAMSTHGRQHHDIELLPNGNILLIVWDERSPEALTQAGGNTDNDIVISEQIIEVQPDLVNGGGTVVWEWKAWDHLIQEVDLQYDDYGVIADHPERIDINFLEHNNTDWLHINGIDYNETFDQIILSVHHFDEFWIIDHSTTVAEAGGSSGGNYGKGGDLLYRWGNPAAYGQGTTNDQRLFGQHHTHWIPEGYPDGGKIIVFNNQAGEPSGQFYSTVDIVELPIDENGNYGYGSGAYDPANFSWTYQALNPTDFFSNIISGAERLPNGNTLICQGVGGRFFEVDQNGNTVWEYVNPVNGSGPINQEAFPIDNNVFRCTRYGPDYPAFEGKTLTPMGYIENGSDIECDLYMSVSTDNNILAETNFKAYPNPSNGLVYVEMETPIHAELQLFNLQGKLLLSQLVNARTSSYQLDLSGFESGVYFLAVSNSVSIISQKLILCE
ncbi:MAG: aryl-sulfate sulfotransferase [Bacteroidota bacterium]